MKKIVVIIPAFNEDKSISYVIDDIPDIVSKVIVIDNSSTDNTNKIAKEKGASVFLENRKGYGFACLKGIEEAKKMNPRPDVAVFLDADYSDFPEQIIDLIKPIIENNFDLVIGSRNLGNKEKGAMLPQQIFGNWLATKLLRLIYKAKFTDLGPFRAIKFKKLLDLDMKDKTFGWTVEMQLKASKNNLKCCEIPVNYRKRVGISKISGTLKGTILAGYKILFTIFKYA